MKKYILYIVCYLLVITIDAQGDFSSYYPVSFETSLHSQAKSGFHWQGFDTTRTMVQLQRKQYLSGFSEISVNAITAMHRFGKNELSLYLYTNQEGEYLSRTRLYAGYARYVSISDKYIAALRCHVGFVNFYFDDSPNSQTYSDLALDVESSLSIFSKHEVLILQLHHLPSSTLQPKDEIVKLNRYAQIYLAKQFPLSPYWKLKAEFSAHIYADLPNDYFVSPYLIWDDLAQCNLGISRTGIVTIGAGSKVYNNFHVLLSYNAKTTWFSGNENVQKIELGLIYKKM